MILLDQVICWAQSYILLPLKDNLKLVFVCLSAALELGLPKNKII